MRGDAKHKQRENGGLDEEQCNVVAAPVSGCRNAKIFTLLRRDGGSCNCAQNFCASACMFVAVIDGALALRRCARKK